MSTASSPTTPRLSHFVPYLVLFAGMAFALIVIVATWDSPTQTRQVPSSSLPLIQKMTAQQQEIQASLPAAPIEKALTSPTVDPLPPPQPSPPPPPAVPSKEPVEAYQPEDFDALSDFNQSVQSLVSSSTDPEEALLLAREHLMGKEVRWKAIIQSVEASRLWYELSGQPGFEFQTNYRNVLRASAQDYFPVGEDLYDLDPTWAQTLKPGSPIWVSGTIFDVRLNSRGEPIVCLGIMPFPDSWRTLPIKNTLTAIDLYRLNEWAKAQNGRILAHQASPLRGKKVRGGELRRDLEKEHIQAQGVLSGHRVWWQATVMEVKPQSLLVEGLRGTKEAAIHFYTTLPSGDEEEDIRHNPRNLVEVLYTPALFPDIRPGDVVTVSGTTTSLTWYNIYHWSDEKAGPAHYRPHLRLDGAQLWIPLL